MLIRINIQIFILISRRILIRYNHDTNTKIITSGGVNTNTNTNARCLLMKIIIRMVVIIAIMTIPRPMIEAEFPDVQPKPGFDFAQVLQTLRWITSSRPSP